MSSPCSLGAICWNVPYCARSFCENLALYLGAQARPRMRMGDFEKHQIGTTSHQLCPTHALLWDHEVCIQSQRNTSKVLLCILRIHTKAMTFLSILKGKPHWENALCSGKLRKRKTFEKWSVLPSLFPFRQVTQTCEHTGSAAQAQRQSLKQLFPKT